MALVLLSSGIAQAGSIFWVSALKEGEKWDQGFVDLLTDNGYTVDTHYDDMAGTPDQAHIDAMNASDLVIMSRSVSSGDYNAPEEYNGVTAPLMLMSPWLTRSSRWGWMDTTDAGTDTQEVLVAADPNHPIFGGAELVDMVGPPIIAGDVGVNTNGTADVGNGTLLASTQAGGNVWAAEWAQGVEFYAGSGQAAGGPRLFFSFGNAEDDAITIKYGGNNATPAGEFIFLNAVDYMAVPEPSAIVLTSVALLGFFGFAGRRRRAV